MRLRTVKGGVFLKGRKNLTKDVAIVPVLPKGDLVYPLAQHSGVPAIPMVKVNDLVLKGQKIAEAPGAASVPIYATVSGRVKAIEPNFVPEGTMGNCIVIENDGEYKEVEPEPVKPLEDLSREDILNLISEAGIVSIGETEFPIKSKLSPKEPEKIKYIIADCLENEPYITANCRRMIENSEEIVSGMKVVLRLFDNAKGVFAIEDDKRDCIKRLRRITKTESRIKVKVLKTKYPQGINTPENVENIILNIETLIAIHDAVIHGRPLTERVVTISGNGFETPGNYKVLLGTNLKNLIESTGGMKEDAKRVILGGQMRGTEISDLDVPITKTTPSILCMKKNKKAECEPSACIRCGRCVEACPSQLVPAKLANYAERDKKKRFIKRRGLECTECGACNYVCPAKRQLKQCITSKESTSPYIRSKVTTTGMMLWVIIALMPTTIFGITKYGLQALIVVLTSVTTAVLSELLFKLITRKKITIGELSAAVTGLLLALNLPSTTPWWICVLGSAFAIIVIKHLFGGLGRNIINPALGAKCILMFLFTERITTSVVDESQNLFDVFIGNIDSTIGGTSVIAILIGATILIMKGIVDIRIPGMYILSFMGFVAMFAEHGLDMHYIVSQICDGSLMLMIWFMATDYGTSPITKEGKILYGLLLGILSGILVILGSAEAISFTIVVGNLLVPLIEWITLPRTAVKTETNNV